MAEKSQDGEWRSVSGPWGPAEWRANADELEAVADELEAAGSILAKHQFPRGGLLGRIASLRNSARLDREYAVTLESSEPSPVHENGGL